MDGLVTRALDMVDKMLVIDQPVILSIFLLNAVKLLSAHFVLTLAPATNLEWQFVFNQ